ncbi:hypothetical protein K457DRAFT_131292 [Linnemannia elongata AG-77]|uniref:F-box domain-containing protein n=1 Tax=Linnemannia elongata AG-77 TaxID=1314771 RepID=A0A197JD61_9FUNG|nr:hypothetical protein K457DRAFT_131292 [Linnemannia elongata AG-77]
MINPSIEKNPLQIPEIRARVSRLVSLEDAISCVRVSKTWSIDFASSIWYTIDFNIHHAFKDLDGDIVTKHGHHIRTIENIKTQSELNAVLCPTIKNHDVALFSGPSIDAFQHKGVVTLVAPIKQVFKPDPESRLSSLGFSLLVHFPNLTDWHCYNLPTDLFVPVERIKTEVTRYCPQVTMINTWISPSPIIHCLVANAFHGLKHVTFEYTQLSMDVIVALLFHRATLLQVFAFLGSQCSYTERDELSLEDDHFQQSGRAVQLLPRCCPHLKFLEFEGHEMDMDIVEEEKWACKGLRQLRVRIRGLDTKEKIDWTLNLWKEGRQKKDEKDTTLSESHMNEAKDTSIETRVARHLLAFEKLEAVWLGTRTFYA